MEATLKNIKKYLEIYLKTWKNHGKIMEFCRRQNVGTLEGILQITHDNEGPSAAVHFVCPGELILARCSLALLLACMLGLFLEPLVLLFWISGISGFPWEDSILGQSPIQVLTGPVVA